MKTVEEFTGNFQMTLGTHCSNRIWVSLPRDEAMCIQEGFWTLFYMNHLFRDVKTSSHLKEYTQIFKEMLTKYTFLNVAYRCIVCLLIIMWES